MDKHGTPSKSVIPKGAQLPLLLLGLPLLIYAGVTMAKQMGWINDVPKAKKVVAPKTSAPATAQTPGGSAPAGPAGAVAPGTPAPGGAVPGAPGTMVAAVPNVESINLPAGKDPLAPVGAEPPPVPGSSPPPTPGVKPSGPPHGPSRSSSPPPLPPPIPVPSGASGFPSPTLTKPTGSAALPPSMRPPQPGPPAVAAAPVAPPAPYVYYPMARAGSGAAPAPPYALVGTISGSKGSLAVVRQQGGTRAQGRYVRPGESLDRTAGQVQAIGQGSLTLNGRAGSQQLSLPPPQGGAAIKPGPAPKASGQPGAGGG